MVKFSESLFFKKIPISGQVRLRSMADFEIAVNTEGFPGGLSPKKRWAWKIDFP